MEFINCSYSYPQVYKRGSRTAVSRKVKAGIYTPVSFEAEKTAVSFHSLWQNFKGDLSLAAKNIRSLVKYAWLIPVAAAVITVPVLAVKFAKYTEAYPKSIDLTNAFISENNLIDAAMADFAVENTWVDADGNIVTENSASSILTPAVFKDPVTYQTYKVKSGDTISGISMKFGLKNISTLIAINNISNVRSLTAGTKLQIPSIDGLVHTVKSGDSLASLSVKYQLAVEDILDVNDLSTDVLTVGQKLFIPGARLDSNTLQKAMGELFAYPLQKGVYRLTSLFGARKDPFSGVASNHKGIDMAAPKGTPIYASKSGTVAYTGFNALYGNYVIINHAEGYQTLYAHMNKITCKKGDKVNQSSRIGQVGSTGYSTGYHLHFSVYKNGKLVNPQSVVK